MAGDWIKLEHVTPDKPEIYTMAEMLNLDPDTVLGKVIRVWIWADQQTLIGDAPSVTKTCIDRVTGVTHFAEALEKVRWLKIKKEGINFPNFDRHNGKSAKTRALTNKRMKRKRDADSVTKSEPEKRREENILF